MEDQAKYIDVHKDKPKQDLQIVKVNYRQGEKIPYTLQVYIDGQLHEYKWSRML